ncbi:MAG: class I SAM-dependent methyltransferase [Candidatus Helarchaeota archaeon]
MEFWWYIIGIVGIVLLIFIIVSFPRKKSERVPSIEGIDEKAVAEGFEKVTNWLPFRLLRRMVIKELRKLDLNGLLVDVGCGSGNLIIQIAENFKSLKLIGVDISDEMIELAKKKATEKGQIERIEFRIGTSENLPFSDNSVDIIISSLSLHHWSNPIKGFEEIIRVLKPNGIFLIFDFRRDSRRLFYGFLTFVSKVVVPKPLKEIKEPLGSLRASYTPKEAEKFLKQLKLQESEIKNALAWMFIIGKK